MSRRNRLFVEAIAQGVAGAAVGLAQWEAGKQKRKMEEEELSLAKSREEREEQESQSRLESEKLQRELAGKKSEREEGEWRAWHEPTGAGPLVSPLQKKIAGESAEAEAKGTEAKTKAGLLEKYGGREAEAGISEKQAGAEAHRAYAWRQRNEPFGGKPPKVTPAINPQVVRQVAVYNYKLSLEGKKSDQQSRARAELFRDQIKGLLEDYTPEQRAAILEAADSASTKVTPAGFMRPAKTETVMPGPIGMEAVVGAKPSAEDIADWKKVRPSDRAALKTALVAKRGQAFVDALERAK